MMRVLFYILSLLVAQITHAESASADPTPYVSHELKISGVIEHEITLSLADLQKMPQQNIATVAQECAKNLAGLKEKGYQGVLLRDLLANISINNADKKAWKRAYIVVHASDDYVAVFSWNEIFNSEIGDAVLIADAANDKPLPDAVGKIALISGCDLHTGARHVKWLSEIEIRLVESL